jgi:hypothetical protein
MRSDATSPLGGFVQQQQARACCQGHGDLEPALLPMRQKARQVVGLRLQRNTFDQLVHPRQRRAADRAVRVG